VQYSHKLMLTDVQYGCNYWCAQINTASSVGKSTAGNSGWYCLQSDLYFRGHTRTGSASHRDACPVESFSGATQLETEAITDICVLLKINMAHNFDQYPCVPKRWDKFEWKKGWCTYLSINAGHSPVCSPYATNTQLTHTCICVMKQL